jgi:hypothetical protein
VNDTDPDLYDRSKKTAALLLVTEAAQRASFPTKLYTRNIPEIRLLPTVYNWEFTRRHPYYLQYQVLAAFHASFPKTSAEALEMGDVWRKAERAAAILRSLGRTGPYIDPSVDGRNMANIPHNNPPFSNPSAHPVSPRHLVACLLRLPRQTRKAVARILTGEGWETDSNQAKLTPEEEMAGLAALNRLGFENDDLTLDRPIPDMLAISAVGSEKGVMDAVRLQLQHLKSKLDLSEQRRLSEDQLDEYLQVWDLREGWADGRYDWSRTMRFQDIVEATLTPLGTVKNRYRAAFRYITGQDYTPELFAALFGPLACQKSKWAGWRRSKQRAGTGSPKLVTNADVLEGSQESSYDPQEYIELRIDLLDLVKRGATAKQIEAELEIPAEQVPALVEFFRCHEAEDA